MTSSKKRIPALFAIIGFIAMSVSAAANDQLTPYTSIVLENPAKHKFDEFDDLIKKAIDLYGQRKYDEAIGVSARAAALRPSDFRPHYVAGISYMGLWKMKSASDSLAKAISLKPGNKQLYYLKAQADRNRNAADESILAARKAIELDPSFGEAYAILGESLAIGSKDVRGAIQAFRNAIKFKPDLFSAYRELGMHLSVSKDEKDVKEAEEVYRKAMTLDPGKMACRFDLGRLLVSQGRLTEARAIWDSRSSDEDNTFPNFIDLLERAEKLKQAKDTLAKKSNDPDALLQMGIMVMEGESWAMDGRQERAIEYFKKALKLKPGFAKAQYELCIAYVQLADFFKEKNKNVDEELAKLRKLDAKLADEVIEYRKTYSGGLKASGGTLDQ